MGEVVNIRDYQPKSLAVNYAELAEASYMLRASIQNMSLAMTNLNEPITFPFDEPPTDSTANSISPTRTAPQTTAPPQ